MKTNFKFTKLMVLMVLVISSACNKDDNADIPQVSAPTASLSNPNFTTAFFTAGQTQAPTVNWNGDTGLFSLGTNIPGTTVNVSNGVISWGKSLPLGSNTIQLIASNSEGQTSLEITIDNQFSGNFDGAYNTDPNSTTTDFDFEMNFNADGTLTAIDGGTSEALGTWTISGTTITSVYSYDAGVSNYTIVTDIMHSETEATISGFWSGGETLSDPASGYISLDIE